MNIRNAAKIYLSGRYLGYIESFGDKVISGWILKKKSQQPVTVDIFLNGEPVARNVTAKAERSDVRDAGFGPANCGFEVRVPPDLIDDAAAEGLIELRESGEETVILRKRLPYRSAPPLPDRASLGKAEPSGASREYHLQFERAEPTEISAWAMLRGAPDQVFDIELLLDGAHFCTLRNDGPRSDLQRRGLTNGRGGIRMDLPLDRLEPGPHRVALRLPDGTLHEKTVEIAAREMPLLSDAHLAYERPLAVIVPVYNAFEDVEICIERLLRFTPARVDILLIDDASPDDRIAPLLQRAAQAPNIRVLTNPENLGFTRTINRGIEETGAADVIFLNSDARVTPFWTEGLRRAAYSGPRVATATAMSDRAGAFSAPEIGNENVLPAGIDEIDYAIAFRRHSLGLYPRVPTGNGFCMYVRRTCIEQIGPLDAEAFPRGYGEENDFCMRALRAGWTHVIDDRTYVFHERTKSFGSTKTDLVTAGRRTIDARYPEYKCAIGIYSRSPEIGMARFCARRALEECRSGDRVRPRVLFVIATTTGGTPQTNRDLMLALGDALEGWTLRCDSRILELSRLTPGGETEVLRHHELREPVDPLTHRSAEYDAVVSDWLLAFDFELVHIRHLVWHSLSLPALIRAQGRRSVFSFHDYYMLSPSIKLVDDEGVYRGGTFTPEHRNTRQSLWPAGSQPDPTGAWLQYWQERSLDALLHCDAYVTTSDSTRSLILEHFPALGDRFHVIPHGRDFVDFRALQEPLIRHDEPIRILLPGNIDATKGLDIILALIEHDRAGLIQFHLLGHLNLLGRPRPPRLIAHGKYRREEFDEKVAQIRPHFGAIFSIWNETFCHTLTELWSVGLPTVVFDWPTLADRMRESGAGWVVDHHDVANLYEELVRLAHDRTEQARARAAALDWQAGTGAAHTTRMMAAAYLDIYREARSGPGREDGRTLRIGVVCPSRSDLREANGSTYIRIWERTRNHFDRDVTYIRMTPDSLLASVRLGLVDGAIIQRTAIPKLLVPALLEAMAQTRIPYMFDLDDDLLEVPGSKDPQGRYADYAPFLQRMLENAALVSTSTPYLQKRLAPHNPRVEVFPNALSGRLWRTPPEAVLRRPDGKLRALYMGTPTHDDDLKAILPALDAVAAKYPDFELSLVGVTAEETLLQERAGWLKRITVPQEVKAYENFVGWIRELAPQFDFGLAPLSDDPFNMSKSDLKLLDYAGMGLQVLASDHPVYRSLLARLPGATSVKAGRKAWHAALEAQIEAGPRQGTGTRELLDWVRQEAFLEARLADFDAAIGGMVRGAGSTAGGDAA